MEVDLHWWLLASAEVGLIYLSSSSSLVEVDLQWWLLAPA